MLAQEMVMLQGFSCKVCKRFYKTSSAALACEAKLTENKDFNEGDTVLIIEPRLFCHKEKKHYSAKGIIKNVCGPKLSDKEYEIKYLGGKAERLMMHVYQYEVVYNCALCKETRHTLFFSPELKSVA